MGLELSITELDVRVRLPEEPEAASKQAETYRDIATFCLRQPGCAALVTWGFADKHSWISSEFPGEGNALIFDDRYQPKPAYLSLREAFQDAVNGAPRITEVAVTDAALRLRGEYFEKGSVVIVDGKSIRPSSVQSSEIIVKDFQRAASTRKSLTLQVQNRSGKLSSPRIFAVE